jgi:hypothetical protein
MKDKEFSDTGFANWTVIFVPPVKKFSVIFGQSVKKRGKNKSSKTLSAVLSLQSRKDFRFHKSHVRKYRRVSRAGQFVGAVRF